MSNRHEHDATGLHAGDPGYRDSFRQGVLAVAPFWLGVAPFTIAFTIAARAAGLNPLEIQLMSVFVFAGAAQMAAVGLLASGAGIISIVATTLIINLRHIIYGMSLDRRLPAKPRPSRPWLAFVLVDESFGLTMARKQGGARADAYYLGVSLGMYGAFVLFTAIGILLGGYIQGIDQLGLEFIFPLVFISLLLPQLVSRRHILVALVAGTAAIALQLVISPGVAILLAICAGAALGAWLEGLE